MRLCPLAILKAGVKDVHKLHKELFDKGYYQPRPQRKCCQFSKFPK